MSSSRGSSVNHLVFSYICGEYTLKEDRTTVSDFVKRAYLGYFGVRFGDQDKIWAPHQVCKTCAEHLQQWTTRKSKSLKFDVPMFWGEPKNHFADCYFCLVNTSGINRNNRNKWTCPDLVSARRPVPHSEEVPMPTFHQLPELCEDECCPSDRTSDTNEDESDVINSSTFQRGWVKWPHQRSQLVKTTFWITGFQVERQKCTETRN